jgi:hypothetical protein
MENEIIIKCKDDSNRVISAIRAKFPEGISKDNVKTAFNYISSIFFTAQPLNWYGDIILDQLIKADRAKIMMKSMTDSSSLFTVSQVFISCIILSFLPKVEHRNVFLTMGVSIINQAYFSKRMNSKGELIEWGDLV